MARSMCTADPQKELLVPGSLIIKARPHHGPDGWFHSPRGEVEAQRPAQGGGRWWHSELSAAPGQPGPLPSLLCEAPRAQGGGEGLAWLPTEGPSLQWAACSSSVGRGHTDRCTPLQEGPGEREQALPTGCHVANTDGACAFWGVPDTHACHRLGDPA